MTRKEKIEYGAFAVLVAAIGCILYFYMFKPQPSTPAPTVGTADFPSPAGNAPVLGAPAAGASAGASATSATPSVSGVPTAAIPSSGDVSASSGGVLPKGTQLQTGILTNPSFVSLVPPVYPQVNIDEVGNTDLFAQPASSSPSSSSASTSTIGQ